MHSDILNYTKLAFNSLKMIQNDSLSANQTGDDRALTNRYVLRSVLRPTSSGSRKCGIRRSAARLSYHVTRSSSCACLQFRRDRCLAHRSVYPLRLQTRCPVKPIESGNATIRGRP